VQAARVPDSIAVACDDACLTYAALNARANQLARHLLALGVGPDTRVAICMPRSVDMLVGIFGILKAGGAYVPLDPTYPQDRLEFIIADAQAPVLLIQAHVLERLPAHGPTVVCVDTDWHTITSYSSDNVVSEVAPPCLAYVIYTSGSTGRPKGVRVTHRNVVHSTRAREAYYRHSADRFLLVSSLAFDSSVAGLFWTLSQGGTLVLPSEGRQSDLGHLAGLIAGHHVSHLLGLPSLYALLLEEVSSASLAALRAVIVAGEACHRALVAQHLASAPHVALFNEYGPTEATVWCTVHHCQGEDTSTSIPIGRPIPDTQVYLLDSRLQPVPIGVTGELYIGGVGVSEGYVNRTTLTAERFLPNPFSVVGGARLYKTGDLGRYRHDGAIEFLGRVDRQVKIRGFRIELGEIEAALLTHPNLAEAVVLARDEARGPVPSTGGAESNCTVLASIGAKRLVAYVVPKPNSSPSPGELREFLYTRLPSHMVPALFVTLTALPLAPNGKVDLKALPDGDELCPATHWNYVTPGTDMERTIAQLWQDVLRLDRVGIHENFFDIGGHSLAMVQVHSRLQAICARSLSLVDMFHYPTIHTLAGYVGGETRQATPVHANERRERTRRESSRRRQVREGRRPRQQVHPGESVTSARNPVPGKGLVRG
jgi:amino acid adenylation domain-containing protein